MKIDRRTAVEIDLLSRNTPDDPSNRHRIFAHLSSLLDEDPVGAAPRPIALNFDAGFQRNDVGFFAMTFLACEAGGGVLIFNIEETSAEVLCRYANGDIFATNEASFRDTHLARADAFIPTF